MQRSLTYFMVLSFLLMLSCKDVETTVSDNKKPSPALLKVNGIIAEGITKVENIKTTGTILPGEKVEIKSEISGRVTSIQFKEGSLVSKGQVLVRLDDQKLKAEKKKILLQVEMEAIKEKRQKLLLEAKAISQEEYDLTLANLNILKSQVDIINTQIAETVITSPFSGKLGFRNISLGAMITPNDVLTTLYNIQPVRIEFSLPEKLVRHIKVGKNISFTLATDKKERSATVYAIDPQINPNSRSLVLRASYANPGGDILPGAFTDILISEGSLAKYIAIPSMAYVPDISGALVYLKKDGKVTPTKVVAASRSESQVFIESGISPGDTVITSGILQIKPGMPVEVSIPQN